MRDQVAARDRSAERSLAGPRELAATGERLRAAEELEPYYRAYRAADGFFVLTCLNVAQRRTTLALLGLEDPFAADPQARPASEPERGARAWLVRRFEATFAREPAAHWIRALRAAGVPAGPVRTLDQLYDDPQALANGLVQDVPAPGGATVRLLGGLFKVEGDTRGARLRRAGARRAHRRGARGARGTRVIAEAGTFAESVATAADRTLTEPEPWRPGAVEDDRCSALTDALARIGWLELGRAPDLLPLVAPAALELGRRVAPLSDIDALLGGSPLAGDLVRYGAARAIGAPARGPAHTTDATSPAAASSAATTVSLRVFAVDRSEPLPYGDALGVHRVLERHAVGDVPGTALAAWIAATTGYLAGLSEWALDVALDHARGRRAFGTTLAGLAPVQQRLADAAARGLRLLAGAAPGAAALAHAGAAAVAVTGACQQVVGAIGFTLEFPLQRAYRRARAVQLWADALIAPSR